MTPQEKCVSLETAKLLAEAGFPQNTERYYLPDVLSRSEKLLSSPGEGTPMYETKVTLTTDAYTLSSDPREEYRDGIIAAPDAQEIGEVLPAHVSGRTNEDTEPDYWLDTYKYDDEVEWAVTYTRHGKDAGVPSERIAHFEDNNEAESRAACWLWLKEKNLL